MNQITKICPRCTNEKLVGEFSKDNSTPDKLQTACKECKRNEQINRKLTHPEKIKEISKRWYNNNKEIFQERVKKYKKENPEVARKSAKKYRANNKQYFRDYDNKRYATNLNHKIKKLTKASISQYIRRNKCYSNSIKYLGYTLNEYKHHLESQFKPEMNWSNHREIWEIDHIIPLSNFDLTKEENIYKAFNYINTQPLFKTTEIAHSYGYMNEIGNRQKSNKI